MLGSAEIARLNPRSLSRPVFFFFFLILCGCATTSSGNPFSATADMDAFLMRVESQNSNEVSVYINPSGKRELLGTVPPRGLEFFEFSYPARSPLRVEVETSMGDRFRIPSPTLAGGGRLDLVVSNNLRRSAFRR